MVESVDSLDELVVNVAWVRDEECEDPDTLPDSEVEKVARWAWQKRLDNSV